MPTDLPSGGDLDDLLQGACGELRRRLEAGAPCQAESFLDALPALASSPHCAVELILTEFEVRQQLGQRPDPLTWLRRFSRWEVPLRRRFQLLGVLTETTAVHATGDDKTSAAT